MPGCADTRTVTPGETRRRELQGLELGEGREFASGLRYFHVTGVGAAADRAIAGKLSDQRWKTHVEAPKLGGLSSFGSIYLSGSEQ
jgi:hypothetical protein